MSRAASRYAVLLHVTNLRFFKMGELSLGGVFAWRCVEADDESGAVSRAIAMLLNEPSFLEDLSDQNEWPPRIEAEEVDELAPDFDVETGNSGYVFYVDDEDGKLARSSRRVSRRHRRRRQGD